MSHSPLLLQLVVILGTARLLGLLLRYFGQTAVIGEMAAGFVVGPVIFGALAPELHVRIFAPQSLGLLNGLSQLGLVLFMFIVGAELRMPSGMPRQLFVAGRIGVLSVLVPMMLGLPMAALLYKSLAPAGVAFWPFALFMAAAVSITAFPVMARILKERGMTQTTVGRLGLTGAAVADALAWVMLAAVVIIASSSGEWTDLARTVGGLGALIAVLFVAVKPLITRLIQRYAADGRPEGALLATLLIGTFASAYITDLLGVHAVFGAFVFGACLPRDDRLLATLIERIEHVAILVLMPIFFALAGLSTTADAFVGAGLGALLLILGVAIAGKVIGSAAAARFGGQSWRTSLAVGSLMNARGMMELIAIKVGLDIGVIGPDLFTMLMVMAIVTTVMTGPLLTLFAPPEASPQPDLPPATRPRYRHDE
jgi:Kef-type K+ transport system membrane component KefB